MEFLLVISGNGIFKDVNVDSFKHVLMYSFNVIMCHLIHPKEYMLYIYM